MRHDEFIGQVQARAKLGSRGEAERATRATLETLAERLPSGLAQNLAAQLPHEIGEHLRRVREGYPTEPPWQGLPDFVEHAGNRGGSSGSDTVYRARVVLEVLDEATTGRILAKVRDSLPEQVRPLIDAGSDGGLNT